MDSVRDGVFGEAGSEAGDSGGGVAALRVSGIGSGLDSTGGSGLIGRSGSDGEGRVGGISVGVRIKGDVMGEGCKDEVASELVRCGGRTSVVSSSSRFAAFASNGSTGSSSSSSGSGATSCIVRVSSS